MSVDLGNLGQTFEANRVPILATAAAGVVGFALYQRHKGAGAAPAAAAAGTDGGVSAGGQLAGMNGAGYYDSSASDVYGLVQPQLESLGNQLTNLQDKLNKVPVTPAPKPTPAPTPKPAPKPAPKPVTHPAPKPAPPHAAPHPAPVPVSHPAHAVDQWVTVNRGDSLSRIAARYPQADITWQSIYNANRKTVGSNPNRIYAGQRLHVVG